MGKISKDIFVWGIHLGLIVTLLTCTPPQNEDLIPSSIGHVPDMCECMYEVFDLYEDSVVYSKNITGLETSYSKNLKLYPDFLEFVKTELSYSKLKECKGQVIENVPCLFWVIYYESGLSRRLHFDESALSDPRIRKLKQFYDDFGREHGCPQYYELYKIQKGETLRKIEKRLNYNQLDKLNWAGSETVASINKMTKGDSAYYKEGSYIKIPCIPTNR